MLTSGFQPRWVRALSMLYCVDRPIRYIARRVIVGGFALNVIRLKHSNTNAKRIASPYGTCLVTRGNDRASVSVLSRSACLTSPSLHRLNACPTVLG